MATIQGVYVALFGRPADPTGLTYFNSVTKNGADLSGIGDLSGTAEYKARFTGLSNVQIINSIYQSLFGRDADVAGLTFFANGLATGKYNINNIAITILDGAQGSDLTIVNNKIAAADLYTKSLDTTAEIVAYSGTAAAEAGRSFLSTVTTTLPTQAAVDAAILTVVNSPNGGTTYTLTTAVDSITGTASNDIVSGVQYSDSTPNSTFTASDTINGGAGSDTLNVVVQKQDGTATGAVTLAAATLAGVETINVRALSGTAADVLTVAASNYSGVTAVNSDRSTSAVTVTGLATGASAGIIGNGVVTNGDLTFGYATSSAAATLNVSGGTKAGNVAISSAPTAVTVNSFGAANTIGTVNLGGSATSLAINASTNLTTGALTGAALTTITASGGATNVTIGGAVPSAVTTIDGSGLTAGGITATLTGAVTSFKGGAGVDTVTTGATTAATAVIDGGAGAADILDLAATNDVTTSAKAGQYVNFEVLRNSTTGTVDAGLFSGITAVQANGNGAGFRNLTAAQAAAVTVRADDTGATFALANSSGTADVLKVTLANSTATASADLINATVNGFETVNIVSSTGSSADTNAVSFAAATDLTSLTISGTAPVSLTTTNIAKAVNIDASGLTFVPTGSNYALTETGNLVKGSVVTGTAAADNLTTTAAITGTTGDFVSYNAGAGNDAISSTVAAINNTSSANGSLKIDGGAGTDTLTLTDSASLTLVDANFQYLTNIENITYAQADKAISITSGGFFDSNFKTSGITLNLGDNTNSQANTVNLQTFTGNATVSLNAGGASTNNETILTGSGNDTVTLLAASTTTGAHSISTGAGNDTINVTINGTTIATGAVTINAGAGQDTINITGNSTANADTASNVIIRVNEGHSTLSASDSVTGFVLNTASKVATSVDFDGTAAVAANVTTATAAAGFTNVNYTITNGLMAFSGTGAASLTAAQKATIAQNVVTAADATVVFTDGSDSYVFHNGVTTDDLVKLVGVSAAGAEATVGTANYVLIA